jgi:crossover junction endodeoxyribonuclease RuvC
MILGIDIGVQGAVAVLDQAGALVEVHDMPTLQDGPKGRRAVNAPLLASIIFKSHATAPFVECVNARPGEGPTGAFAFGRARGVIEGVLAAAGTPPAWKRAIGLTLKSKDAARSEASNKALA